MQLSHISSYNRTMLTTNPAVLGYLEEGCPDSELARNRSRSTNFGMRLRQVILDAIEPENVGGTVLEIGCGDGALATSLISVFSRVVAIDRRPQNRRIVAGVPRKHTIVFVSADFEYYDFEVVKKFNVIICAFSLHHLRLNNSLAKICTLLCDGGQLIILDLFAERRQNVIIYLFDQFILSNYQTYFLQPQSPPQLRPFEVAAYIRDRIVFLFTRGGMRHVVEDLERGRPFSYAEWKDAFERYMPGGKMSIIAGSTFIFTWRKPSINDQPSELRYA